MTWPMNIPATTVQRVADVQAQLALERSGHDVIAAWQAQRLTELVHWLLNKVPWWQAWLGPRVDLALWDSLPILTRLDLRKMVATQGAAPVPDHHGAVSAYFWAGPTGGTARFFTSAFNQRMVDHAFYADHQRHGRNPFATQGCLADDIPLHEGTHIAVPPSLDNGVGPQLLRQLNLFTKLQNVRWLQGAQLTYLTTTPQCMDEVLDEARTRRLRMPEIRQILTYGTQVSTKLRAKARKQLGASVRHRYTCLECGPLAFQCPRSDDYFHVAVGNVLLEVVDDHGKTLPLSTDAEQAHTGRVLVTALHQYATPMLRHDIGDTAALHHQCPGCNLDVPTLSQLQQGA
jgi:phenylacetate-CoA ligase